MTSFEHRKLGFGRVDHTNETARGRGKQNIAYEDPSGKQFFAKYVDLAGGEHYAVEALQHEQAMLRRLADTGVTPKAGEIKFYPNREAPQKARLLIEYLPGTSLDQGVDKDHPTETIQATALAYYW